MTPVDLNRLREAHWDIDCPEEHGLLVDAVLDAPTVWWCFTNMRESEPGLGIDHTQVVCELCDDWEDCGWVALVPVKGANDAT